MMTVIILEESSQLKADAVAEMESSLGSLIITGNVSSHPLEDITVTL